MSIKNYISIIILLLLQTKLSAQKDTVYQTQRQENGEYNAPIIETPSDRAFRTKVPSKLMFKMNLAQTILNNDNRIGFNAIGDGNTPLGLAVEYKLLPAFSIGAYYGMALGFQPKSNFNNQDIWYKSNFITLESRWYHDMKKRIRTGRGANNFGGKYLALEAGIINNYFYNVSGWKNKRIALRYGLQQRFMRNGYFDISVGAGITGPSSLLNQERIFSIDQRVAIGLAAFLPKVKSATQDGGLCDILHCQDEQYNMLKINLFDALNFQSVRGFYHSMKIRPNVAFEHKIGRSPFSIELDLSATHQNFKYKLYSYTTQKDVSYNFRTATWNAMGELRWYYSMRKRILNGRSGNNLSGTFIGLNLNCNNLIKDAIVFKSDNSNLTVVSNIKGDYWTGNLVWGVQQRVLDRGFIQFKIGAGSTFGGNDYLYNGENQPLTKIKRTNELNLVADLKVGFAF